MSQKLIITNLQYYQKEYTVCALYEGRRLIEVSSQLKDGNHILGNIYAGRVKDIVKNLNAAFIEIAPGIPCYYPLDELKNPVYVKKINNSRLVQGDELYVQVERESMKNKPPKVTTNLNFTGKYLVLTTGNQTLGISKKIKEEARSRLKQMLKKHKPAEFGLIVRTNSQTADEEQILHELDDLNRQARNLVDRAPYQTCFSCVLRQQPDFLKILQNIHTSELESIVTDQPELYNEIYQYLTEYQPMDLPKLIKYEDDMLNLAQCYSLKVKIDEALKERVWLKSGGYLMIQPTEALTVIDVNTGKSTAKCDVQKHHLKVNLEAAEEIAAQLRLRNISGIIIIDFINMMLPEAKEQLMEALCRFTLADPVPVQVVDMTRLNLVELTRKKVKKSLKEQFDYVMGEYTNEKNR